MGPYDFNKLQEQLNQTGAQLSVQKGTKCSESSGKYATRTRAHVRAWSTHSSDEGCNSCNALILTNPFKAMTTSLKRLMEMIFTSCPLLEYLWEQFRSDYKSFEVFVSSSSSSSSSLHSRNGFLCCLELCGLFTMKIHLMNICQTITKLLMLLKVYLLLKYVTLKEILTFFLKIFLFSLFHLASLSSIRMVWSRFPFWKNSFCSVVWCLFCTTPHFIFILLSFPVSVDKAYFCVRRRLVAFSSGIIRRFMRSTRGF